MDFGTLLHHAQRNGKDGKKEGVRCYNTKFEPPKKEQRVKQQLSVNIKKFLAKKEAEEKAKQLEANRKKEELLALRSKDKKATRRVNVMLKRTKSANQSVIQDAVDTDNTSVTLAGPIQPDEDDYGYVSQEAAAYYNKMMEKYNKMPDEPKFNQNRKKVSSDLNSTKERVRAAIEREREEALLPHKRKRKHKEDSSDSRPKEDYYGKHEPELEPNIPKKKPKLPAPPPMNFNDLLKLAEKKQFEPIVIETKPKEEEKLYTKKQKKEIEREREYKERKEAKSLSQETSKPSTSNKHLIEKVVKPNTDLKLQKVDSVRRTEKVESLARKPTDNLLNKKNTDLTKKISLNKQKIPATENELLPNINSNFSSKNQPLKLKSALESKQKDFARPNHKEIGKPGSKVFGKSSNREISNSTPSKQSVNLKPKQFPPRDLKPKQFNSMNKSRDFPPRDLKRKPLINNKRRILDDDDEEYDSEMDDFIDDGPEESEDYSKVIREIFKYDKSKYRNIDDDDDNMESTFAQQMREEVISTKIGIMEDLEDMKKEEEEKRRKAMTKKKYK